MQRVTCCLESLVGRLAVTGADVRYLVTACEIGLGWPFRRVVCSVLYKAPLV